MHDSRLLLLVLAAALSGCSIQSMAVDRIGDALAGSGTTISADNDPQFVRDALPFSLKLIESLIAESPRHSGLLIAAASGFTQYAYAFIQQDADRIEPTDFEAAQLQRVRARNMYLRARDYGLRGLELKHPGMRQHLQTDPRAAVRGVQKEQVPLLYWTAASWGSAISLSKDDPDLIADQPAVEALIDRAYALDPDWNNGSIRSFLITYEFARVGAQGDPYQRAQEQFDRVIALTGGQAASPYVSYAENIAVGRQDLADFKDALEKALAIDPDARPEWRLENLIFQDRARWLLGRAEDLILTEAGGDGDFTPAPSLLPVTF